MAEPNKEVFISYNGKNFDQALYLCNLLEGAGITCWIAPRDIPPATPWAESIVQGIQNCSVLALLVSSTSLVSPEVAKEVDLANTTKKDILPIRVEDVLLTGPLQYHLSSRQWVDAFKGEKITRFQAAVDALMRILQKTLENTENGMGVLGQAKGLVARLNQRHAKELDLTNAMISVQGTERDKVSIFFPLRIGATGVDLISEFDSKSKQMRIFAHAASNGDPLKTPFGSLIKGKYGSSSGNNARLPDFAWNSGYRYEFVTLMPATNLTTPLLSETAEAVFPRFASHVDALSRTVLTDLLNWSAYAQKVTIALNDLEAQLRLVFPEDKGWKIAALQGARLSGFRSGGRINVFKDAWCPKRDNYKERGLLSFTLEAGGDFLRSLKIGVLKYEKWLDMGEYGQEILSLGKEALGDAVKSSDGYALELPLPDDWQDSGIFTGENRWDGKLDSFVEVVIEKFKSLATLAGLVERACAELPALQNKQLDQFTATEKMPWWMSGLYVQNRLRLLAEKLNARNSNPQIKVDYRIRHNEWAWSDVFLAVKVGNFDAAIAFRFGIHRFSTEVVSIEPPDFETTVVKAFLAKHHPELPFTSAPEKGICHGLSLPEWMDRFEALADEQVEACLTAMGHLVRHLEQCRSLTEHFANELHKALPEGDGWVVENHAGQSLEVGDGIAVYRKAWLPPSYQTGGPVPMLVQIVPNRPCFDELWLEISFLGQPITALERPIGRMIGASDFAFLDMVSADGQAPAQAPAQTIWARPLQGALGQTGGSRFEATSQNTLDRDQLSGELHVLAQKIKQLEPILADACRIYNDLQFKAAYANLLDRMATTLAERFPQQDGWVISNMAGSGNRYGFFAIFKPSWQQSGYPLGDFFIAVEGNSAFFDNLLFGIKKASNQIECTKGQAERLSEVLKSLGSGKQSEWWPWWQSAKNDFRYSGGSKQCVISGEALERFVQHHAETLRQVANLATPLIEEILGVKATAMPTEVGHKTSFPDASSM